MWRSTRTISVLIPTDPAAPADSISTRLPLRSVSPTSLPGSWYSARMSVPSSQNKDKAMQMLKAKLYLLKQQEAEAKAFRYPWRSERISDGATRSVPMLCSHIPWSRITVPTRRPVMWMQCWMAALIFSSMHT